MIKDHSNQASLFENVLAKMYRTSVICAFTEDNLPHLINYIIIWIISDSLTTLIG